MNHERLADSLTSITSRLIEYAAHDAELRSQLHQLAQLIVEATSTLEPPAGAGQKHDAIETAQQVQVPSIPPPLPELTLGRSKPAAEPAVPSYPAHWIAPQGPDLALVESRCRLKAEGARWAATRRRLLSEGATFATDIDPKDRDIVARAKAVPDCFLWMCHPTGPSPEDLGLYEMVAGCFETVADASAVVRQLENESDLQDGELDKSLDLLAEAQSALRSAIQEIDGPVDSDQMVVYQWLRATANERQIYIQRFMRVDDPADASAWQNLSARIEQLDSRIQESRTRDKRRRKLLGKVRHKASIVAADPDAADDDWRILAAAVGELVADGLPASNRDFRELLLPVIDSLPELPDVPSGFISVMEKIDRYLATCPPTESTIDKQPTPDVQEVSRLLRGRSVVLIGGVRRPGSYEAIKDTFGLKYLTWITTKEHQSVDSFEPYVARPDVAVVLLAIRWSSHSFGDVREFCERHGKPLVRLPGGYNPNQVADQIMSQCSERLSSKQS